jgi:hypothetical protein
MLDGNGIVALTIVDVVYSDVSVKELEMACNYCIVFSFYYEISNKKMTAYYKYCAM